MVLQGSHSNHRIVLGRGMGKELIPERRTREADVDLRGQCYLGGTERLRESCDPEF